MQQYVTGRPRRELLQLATEIFPFGLALAHPTRREFIAHLLEDASYVDLYQHECIMPTKMAFNKPLYELSHTSSELAGIFVLHLPKRPINSYNQERFYFGLVEKKRFSSAYSSNTSAGLFLHGISVSVSPRFSVRIRFNIDCDILLLINPLCARNTRSQIHFKKKCSAYMHLFYGVYNTCGIKSAFFALVLIAKRINYYVVTIDLSCKSLADTI